MKFYIHNMRVRALGIYATYGIAFGCVSSSCLSIAAAPSPVLAVKILPAAKITCFPRYRGFLNTSLMVIFFLEVVILFILRLSEVKYNHIKSAKIIYCNYVKKP